MPMTLAELEQIGAALEGLKLVKSLEAATQSAVDATATQAGSVEMGDGIRALGLVLDEKSVAEVCKRVDRAQARVGLVPVTGKTGGLKIKPGREE